jgi:hypothetical protein
MPLFALGIVFAGTGVVIVALTFRSAKSKPLVNPTKAQLREQAVVQSDANKLRLAGGIITGLGAVLIAIS